MYGRHSPFFTNVTLYIHTYIHRKTVFARGNLCFFFLAESVAARRVLHEQRIDELYTFKARFSLDDEPHDYRIVKL